MWNVLTKNYLNYFDIEIRTTGHLFPRSAIADFVMVLMFEVVDEINENIDDVVAYGPRRIVRVTLVWNLTTRKLSPSILNNNGSYTRSRFSRHDQDDPRHQVTTLTPSTPTSDARSIKTYASSLAAVGISLLMLAYSKQE